MFGPPKHWANFDKKVHKPQSYRTLPVYSVKKILVLYIFFKKTFSTCFAFFTLELTILARAIKTKLIYVMNDVTEILE